MCTRFLAVCLIEFISCLPCQQGSIHHALTLFPAYVRVPDVCEVILDFFLTAFAGLQQQLGASFTESTVQTFLDLFTR